MKPHVTTILFLLLSSCATSPFATKNQTAEEVAADLANRSTSRLCESLTWITSGQCFADREAALSVYSGYCSKMEAATMIELANRAESCPKLDTIASNDAIQLPNRNVVLASSKGDASVATAPHWSHDVISSLSKFEELINANQLSWKSIDREPKGQFETESEYQNRISNILGDGENLLVYTKSSTNSVVTEKDGMQDFVLFEFSPFEEFEIASNLSRSFYEGQNAFGATRVITAITGEKVQLSPISKVVNWPTLRAIENGYTDSIFFNSTHENIPLARSQLIESGAEIVVIRIFSVDVNNQQTYTVSGELTSPTINLPVENNILIKKIRASLEYAGLYDETNKQFVAVFSPDLHSMYILNDSKEVDLTSIPSDMPFEWRY